MTIRELQENMWVDTSPTSGRPSILMSDKAWQQKFQYMKSIIKPSRFRKLQGIGFAERIYNNEEKWDTYHGVTNWQSYCNFINDSLYDLRSGKFVYCYFCYQIRDLLRFEYQNLRTKYYPEAQEWCLWLKNNQERGF